LATSALRKPYFIDNKNIFAFDTTFLNSTPHPFFVLIDLRSINYTIAYTQSISYATLRLSGNT